MHLLGEHCYDVRHRCVGVSLGDYRLWVQAVGKSIQTFGLFFEKTFEKGSWSTVLVHVFISKTEKRLSSLWLEICTNIMLWKLCRSHSPVGFKWVVKGEVGAAFWQQWILIRTVFVSTPRLTHTKLTYGMRWCFTKSLYNTAPFWGVLSAYLAAPLPGKGK